MRRIALFLILVCGGVVFPHATPAPAQTQPRRTFTRTPASGPPGIAIEVSGTGCIEDGEPFATAVVAMTPKGGGAAASRDVYEVQPDGTWAGELLVPFDAPEGSYVLSASCRTGNRTVPAGTAAFEVTAAPPDEAPTPGPTPTSTTRRPASAAPSAFASPSASPEPSPSVTPPAGDPLAVESSPGRSNQRTLPIALIAGGVAVGALGAFAGIRRRAG